MACSGRLGAIITVAGGREQNAMVPTQHYSLLERSNRKQKETFPTRVIIIHCVCVKCIVLFKILCNFCRALFFEQIYLFSSDMRTASGGDLNQKKKCHGTDRGEKKYNFIKIGIIFAFRYSSEINNNNNTTPASSRVSSFN